MEKVRSIVLALLLIIANKAQSEWGKYHDEIYQLIKNKECSKLKSYLNQPDVLQELSFRRSFDSTAKNQITGKNILHECWDKNSKI